MLTFTTQKRRNNKQDFLLNERGFSLLEIMIALAIGALVIGMAATIGFNYSSHDKLEETIDKFERAIRFAKDEAVLRNTIIRVRVILDKSPQEFVVEYGPSDNFVLPKSIKEFGEVTTLEEQERQEALRSKINREFTRVKEFNDSNEILPEDVKIAGVGTSSYGENLIFDPEASIFVYPSGEKDSAIIILGTTQEMATLKTEAFTLDFYREYKVFDQEISEESLPDELASRSKKEFEEWLKN